MGSSTSVLRDYQLADPPSERHLDWERWEAACRFWKNLVDENDVDMKPVRTMLNGLAEGPLPPKIVVLAKAWGAICNNELPTSDTILPNHHEFPETSARFGQRPLLDRDTFGGVDCCHWPVPDLTEPLTEEEKEEVKARAAEERRLAEAKKMENKVETVRSGKQGVPAPEPPGPLDNTAEKAVANLGKGANGKPLTAKQVQAAQTAKAIADDKVGLDGKAAADVERAKAKAIARKQASSEE